MRKIKEEMDALPENTWLSREYGQRWSGRLCIDGKYIAVKGYEKKVVFLYCIDYLTHDIPVGILAPSEIVFSIAAILHGFDLFTDDIPVLKQHPVYLIIIGVLALLLTGKLYESLEKMK